MRVETLRPSGMRRSSAMQSHRKRVAGRSQGKCKGPEAEKGGGSFSSSVAPILLPHRTEAG